MIAYINHTAESPLSNVTSFTNACASNDGGKRVIPSANNPFSLFFFQYSLSQVILELKKILSIHQMTSLRQNPLPPKSFTTITLDKDHIQTSWLDICLSQLVIPLKVQFKKRTFILQIQDTHYLSQLVRKGLN